MLRDSSVTMARVAPSDLVVHVTGETGTGKETVAEAMHRHSLGRPGRFVAVNASSLSDELFESEMFGHVRGAFTGAVATARATWPRRSAGRCSSTRSPISPRARRPSCCGSWSAASIAASGRAWLRRRTSAGERGQRDPRGRLRPDLIFRLKDVVLALPPLRARGDDLWRWCRTSCARVRGRRRPDPIVTADARRRLLESYSWPGNVRELHREIRRAVVMSGGQARSGPSTCHSGSRFRVPRRGRSRTPCAPASASTSRRSCASTAATGHARRSPSG